MPRPTTPRTFKPSLESLEERVTPAEMLLPNLQYLYGKMSDSANNFVTDQAVLAGFQNNSSASVQTIGKQYTRTTTDYQQMISDQFAIQQTGAADILAVNTAAYASGNQQFIALALFYFDPQFQNVINQANATVDNVSAQANQTYVFASVPGVTWPSIASQVGVT